MDLALTATYFPHCGLTYAILFGCPLSVEEEIIKRLSFATAEAAHPLLMPGIFAEIERSRHVHVVEATLDELETRIFELDLPSERESMLPSEAEKRNQKKRTAWLDTTYLRNALVSWNIQLAKMSNHIEELKSTVFKPNTCEETTMDIKKGSEDDPSNILAIEFKPSGALLSSQPELSESSYEDRLDDEQSTFHRDHFQRGKESQGALGQSKDSTTHRDHEVVKDQMRRIGNKIKNRIQAIIDEYDDKIRDCTMRIDGMAMATQWVYSSAMSLATKANSVRHIVKQTLKLPWRQVANQNICDRLLLLQWCSFREPFLQ